MKASPSGAGRSATLRPRTSRSAMKESESAVRGNKLSFPRKKQSKSADRITQLPDTILCHILSFVPFNQSVQTSILSKRWLRIWTHLPIIDVDDSTLRRGSGLFSEQSAYTSFINFLSNVFDRCHTSTIDKFILKCSKFDVFRVTQWINAAVKHRVRELDLRIAMKECLDMSCSLFAYQELVTLKLEGRFVLDVPGSLLFPSLKQLNLRGIEFDDEAIHNFLSGCPVLEDLDIVCSTEKWKTLVINAPALRFFKIYAGVNEDGDDLGESNEFRFVLDSPNLEVLKYTSPEASHGVHFGKLYYLVKAEIDIFPRLCDTEYDYDGLDDFGVSIVWAFNMAKTICLTKNTMKIFEDFTDWPHFNKLTELRVGVNNACYPYGISTLLVYSPNLKVLVINVESDEDDLNWELPFEEVPECVSEHLEVVNIWGFNGQKCIAEYIIYLLQNGKVLKECSASPSRSKLEEVELNKKLEVRVNRELLDFLL